MHVTEPVVRGVQRRRQGTIIPKTFAKLITVLFRGLDLSLPNCKTCYRGKRVFASDNNNATLVPVASVVVVLTNATLNREPVICANYFFPSALLRSSAIIIVIRI